MKETSVHKKRVLFADNIAPQLEARAEFLENAGYEVIKAGSPVEAEQALLRENIHLAVLDIRLMDDNDDGDISGIVLAKDERFKRIPKILVTAFPTYDAVVEAYGSVIGNQSVAQAFLAKKEGPEALVKAVDSTFENLIGIRWDLRIGWDEAGLLSFPYLALLIDPEMEPTRLESCSSELRDLFCKLFAAYEQITIEGLHWARDGCVCLTLYASEKAMVKQFVVVCGMWEQIMNQRKQGKSYFACEPRTLEEPQCLDTVRYAGLVYSLPSGDRGALMTGLAFFREATERNARQTLENLFMQALGGWHQRERSEIAKTDLGALYRTRLGIAAHRPAFQEVRGRVQQLGELVKARGLLREFALGEAGMELVFPNRETFQGPDPLAALFEPTTFDKQPAIMCATFGGLRLGALLVDLAARVYLTDMSRITRSHLLEDFAALECEFRFGEMSSTNLLTLRDLEKQLCEVQTLSTSLQVGNVEPEYRRALANVNVLRKLASEMAGDALEPYLVGLFYYTLQPFLTYDPRLILSDFRAAELAHRLMSASMMLIQIWKLAESRTDPAQAATLSEQLVIHEATREVFVGGRLVHLTGTEFKLLSYLYKYPERVCTREEILAELFGTKGKPTITDKGMLNTHIDRLRKKIDLNPSRHRYILTVRGQGYRLDLKD